MGKPCDFSPGELAVLARPVPNQKNPPVYLVFRGWGDRQTLPDAGDGVSYVCRERK